jgi:hypothetical protein
VCGKAHARIIELLLNELKDIWAIRVRLQSPAARESWPSSAYTAACDMRIAAMRFPQRSPILRATELYLPRSPHKSSKPDQDTASTLASTNAGRTRSPATVWQVRSSRVAGALHACLDWAQLSTMQLLPWRGRIVRQRVLAILVVMAARKSWASS